MDSEVKTALVDKLPDCDVCKLEATAKGDFSECKTEPAEYDAQIPGSSWANLCQHHFDLFGCSLGLGMGQKLVVRGSAKHPAEVVSKADELCRRCGKNCAEDSMNKETMRHRILDNPIKINAMLSIGLYCEEI